MSESILRVSAQGWGSAQRLAAENRLFAILDACDAPAVPRKADELGLERAFSLYLGHLDPEHWPIGPYLFKIDTATLEWLADSLRQTPWGIFVVAQAAGQTLQGLFAHFRKFVTIGARDRKVYFRFYDPRVLPQYLQRAPADKLHEFFGPCKFFGGANGESEELSWYWLNGS
jgi:uncharacterized protein DUF4123